MINVARLLGACLVGLVVLPVLATLPAHAQNAIDKPIASYVALLSSRDHFNSNGVRLTEPWQIIRQDRANFHRYGIRDPQDEWDSFFASIDNRAAAEQMLMNGYIEPSARNAIVNGEVLVRVFVITGPGDVGLVIRVEVL